MGLLMRDNHRGNYITINNLVEFVDGIWERLLRTDSEGKKVLYHSQYEELKEKIGFILNVYFKIMASNGEMDGGQLLPMAIIEGEEFTRETNRLRIQCIKHNTMFSKYREEISKYLAYEPPQRKD